MSTVATHIQGHHELFELQKFSAVRLARAQLLDDFLEIMRLSLPRVWHIVP